MTDINEFEPPKSSTGDTAHLAAKEILSLVPGAAALFEYFIKSPLEKRREIWMEMVAEALRELENARFDIGKLKSDERFITIVVQATTVAIRNHQQEKLLALRNAVINAATSPDLNEDIQLLFIRYVDELTPSHIQLLTFITRDVKDLAMLKSYTQLFESFDLQHPNLMPRDEFRMLIQDLSARGLIRISTDIEDFDDIYQVNALTDENTNEDLPRVIITDIAEQFLDFITVESQSAA